MIIQMDELKHLLQQLTADGLNQEPIKYASLLDDLLSACNEHDAVDMISLDTMDCIKNRLLATYYTPDMTEEELSQAIDTAAHSGQANELSVINCVDIELYIETINWR